MVNERGEKAPIERPVTAETVIRLAKAGYPDLVLSAIGLSDLPISRRNGSLLVEQARLAKANEDLEEARKLKDLAGLSDDPRWGVLFQPRLDELTRRLEPVVSKRLDALKEYPEVPFKLRPRLTPTE